MVFLDTTSVPVGERDTEVMASLFLLRKGIGSLLSVGKLLPSRSAR